MKYKVWDMKFDPFIQNFNKKNQIRQEIISFADKTKK